MQQLVATPGVLWQSSGKATQGFRTALFYPLAQSLHPWLHTWTGVQATSMSQAPAEGQYCMPGLPAPLPAPQDKPSTDSTIKNTILCSSVAPGDRHPDAERPLASWPDGRALPPTHTDRPWKEGVCYKTRALSFLADMRSFAHGAAGGADADSGRFLCSSSKGPHAPVLNCRLLCPLRVLMCCDRKHVIHAMPGQSSLQSALF